MNEEQRLVQKRLRVLAFGSSIGGFDAMLIVTVTTLATLLPISFGGLGVREISFTALLMAFGIAPSVAVAIALIDRCFIWILSSVGGLWFVFYKARREASSSKISAG